MSGRCLEDVVTVDDAVEHVEDGVDGDGESGWTAAGTELREPDQRAEHYRRLLERLHTIKHTLVSRYTCRTAVFSLLLFLNLVNFSSLT